jgi:hypothetical protein
MFGVPRLRGRAGIHTTKPPKGGTPNGDVFKNIMFNRAFSD